MVSENVIASRFWSKVALKQFGCYEWLAGKSDGGYGQFSHGRTLFAHRFAYEDIKGPIPHGLTIDHLCRNRGCVNPDHLEPVTRGENVLRGEGHAPTNAKKTHCQKGHEYTEENTYVNRNKRYCMMCLALAKPGIDRRYREKNRERLRVYFREHYAANRDAIRAKRNAAKARKRQEGMQS